jgi:hypothetical protein
MALFGGKDKPLQPGQPAEAAFKAGELVRALRPFVMPVKRLPPGVADGAPVVLPGMVMATAVVRGGGGFDFLPMAIIQDLDGTGPVGAQAMKNIENLDGFDMIRED